MSTGRGRGGGAAAAAGGVGGGRVGRAGIASNSGVQIPASALKVVQSLKEIVRNSDDEIYSMLKICNMDLNETVQRLLNDGMFLFCLSTSRFGFDLGVYVFKDLGALYWRLTHFHTLGFVFIFGCPSKDAFLVCFLSCLHWAVCGCHLWPRLNCTIM
jgi:hypothetical protein